jgi:hypothetical protein
MKKKPTIKKKESESYYEEQYHLLLKENKSLTNLSFGFFVVMFFSLAGMACLVRSGDELTKKVRRYARAEEIERNSRIFTRACFSISNKAYVLYGQCHVGNAVLNTLEEIKQAKLHFDLGDNK